jgi:hypothetical protein
MWNVESEMADTKMFFRQKGVYVAMRLELNGAIETRLEYEKRGQELSKGKRH